MKNNHYEKLHRLILLICLIICFAFSIFSITRSIIDFMGLEKAGVFEAVLIMLANILMSFVVGFTIFTTISSFKKGSTFMKELCLTPRRKTKLKSQIFFACVALVSLTLFIVFILMYADVIHNTVFPKALDTAMVTFTMLLLIGGISFFTYGYAIGLDEEKTNHEKNN